MACRKNRRIKACSQRWKCMVCAVSATAPRDDKRLESRLAVFPDYFWVPVGALWKTSVTGRLPKNGKLWNKAKNSCPRLSCVVCMMIVVMAPDSPIGSGPLVADASPRTTLGSNAKLMGRPRCAPDSSCPPQHRARRVASPQRVLD